MSYSAIETPRRDRIVSEIRELMQADLERQERNIKRLAAIVILILVGAAFAVVGDGLVEIMGSTKVPQ